METPKEYIERIFGQPEGGGYYILPSLFEMAMDNYSQMRVIEEMKKWGNTLRSDEPVKVKYPVFDYSFHGYTVLDVISIAGDDEHEINATEARQILDIIRDEWNGNHFTVNVDIITYHIGKFIKERETALSELANILHT